MILGQLSNYLIWHTSCFSLWSHSSEFTLFSVFPKILIADIASKVVKQCLIHYVIVLKIVVSGIFNIHNVLEWCQWHADFLSGECVSLAHIFCDQSSVQNFFEFRFSIKLSRKTSTSNSGKSYNEGVVPCHCYAFTVVSPMLLHI